MRVGHAAVAHAPVEQLNALTSLRFFAASYVLFFHYVPEFLPQSPLLSVTKLGYTGVTFFFVLSGFILAHNYGKTDFSVPSARQRYYAARISRIVPVFLLSLLLSIPFAYAQWAKMEPGVLKLLAGTSAVLAPLGLQAWVPGASCAINCPTWSISAEFFFYLLFPFLILPVQRNPRRWFALAGIAWLVMCLVYGLVWSRFGDGLPLILDHPGTAATLAAQWIKYFPVGRLPEFVLGVVLYVFWSRNRDLLPPSAGLYGFCAASVLMLLVGRGLPEIPLHNGLTAVVWAPLILAAASMRQGVLCSTSLIFLGRISFALYLLHVPVLNVAKALDKRVLHGMLAQHPEAAMVGCFAAALVASAIVFLLVEEPMRRPVQRFVAWLRPANSGGYS